MSAPTLLLDCDGVLAETEHDGHRRAFNATFAEVGLPIHWSETDYARLLRIGGGKERMAAVLTPEFVAAAGLPAEPDQQRDVIQSWYRRKTAHYVDLVRSGRLPARPGIARLIKEAAAAGWTLAVASTSGAEAVGAVLGQVAGDLAGRFTVFAGDMVPRKKPAPDIYRLAVRRLGAAPSSTVVIEDSQNGLAAARAAGLPTVITTSRYTTAENFTGAALVLSSLGDEQEPARVIADPYRINPGVQVGLADLRAVLQHEAARPQEIS